MVVSSLQCPGEWKTPSLQCLVLGGLFIAPEFYRVVLCLLGRLLYYAVVRWMIGCHVSFCSVKRGEVI